MMSFWILVFFKAAFPLSCTKAKKKKQKQLIAVFTPLPALSSPVIYTLVLLPNMLGSILLQAVIPGLSEGPVKLDSNRRARRKTMTTCYWTSGTNVVIS